MRFSFRLPWKRIPKPQDRQVFNAVKTVLTVGAVAAESFPPAKAVITSLLEVLKVVGQVTENSISIGMTIQRLEHVERIIVASVRMEDRRAVERAGMIEAQLRAIAEELHSMARQNTISKIITSDDDKNRIQICIGQIRDIVTEFQLDVQLDDHDRMQTIEATVLLQKLRHSEDAAYEMGQREDHTGKRTHCMPGTRTETLGRLELWLADDGDYRLFWLNGMAGTGKSTIADSLARYARSEGIYGAGFFCSRDFDNARDLNRIFPSLAYQLAFRVPQYRDQLLNVLRTRGYVPGDLKQQLVELILEPLKRIAATISRPIVIIIDALDECHNDHSRPLPLILFLLRHSSDCRSARVKFFISSRPANEISQAFAIHAHDRLNLHDVPLPIVSRDIGTFVTRRLQQITLDHPSFTFTQNDVRTIVERSGGLFVFASTVCRLIDGSTYDSPQDQLVKFTSPSDSGVPGLKVLDMLYRQVFINAFTGQDSDNQAAKQSLRDVMASVVLVSRPLRLSDLVMLLGPPYTSSQLRRLLAHMHSVMHVPDNDNDPSPIRMFHASFADHITDIKRAHPDFHVESTAQHQILLERCLQVMDQSLVTDNICHLPPHIDYGDVQDLKFLREKHIPGALEYACRFWTDHLVQTLPPGAWISDDLLESLTRFTTRHLLRWIEVLTIVGELENVVPMLVRARTALSDESSPRLGTVCSLLYDAERLVFQSYDAVRTSTLQVYLSALPFSPKNTLLRTTYLPSVSSRLQLPAVLAGVSDRWDTRLRTIEIRDRTGLGNERVVTCVAISSDSSTIVCGTWRGSLMLWDLETGAFKFTLEGGSGAWPKEKGSILSVSFLQDGRLRAGSSVGIVRTWDSKLNLGIYDDITLGTRCYTLASTANGTHIVGLVPHVTPFGFDPCVRLWVLSTSDSYGGPSTNPSIVKQYDVSHPPLNTWTYSNGLGISFSPNNLYITLNTERSGTRTYTVASVLNGSGLRDPDSNDLAPHILRDATLIVWSHSSDLIACAHSDGAISLSASTSLLHANKIGEKLYRPGGRSRVSSLAFTPDDQRLAVGYDDSSLCWWDIRDAVDLELVSSLEGGVYGVDLLTFSPNGSRVISGSPNDITVWDTLTQRDDIDQLGSIISSASGGWVNRQISFSPNGTWLACTSANGEFFKLIGTGDDRLVLEAEAVDVVEGFLWNTYGTSLTIYHRSGASLYDISTESLNCVHQYLIDSRKSVRTAATSPDGAHLLLATRDNELLVYKSNSEHPLHVLQVKGDIYSLAWSVTDVIAFGTFSDRTWFWNFKNLEDEPLPIPDYCTWHHPGLLLAFSPDGSWLAVYNGISVCTYDVRTRVCLSSVEFRGPSNCHGLSVASDAREIWTDRGLFSVLEGGVVTTMQGGHLSEDAGHTCYLGEENCWVFDRQGRRQVRLRAFGDRVAVADESGRVLILRLGLTL
ncbi:hypothetical protein EIP91_007197 [Steccherinum ochraceum]|uniref:NACHT domain-containing protein n=1 Tax=Steccherinum ochraceum TaxID=92696 RepID=A0A4R0RF40_9APHY|nr:hypothetical protein EIP91_007197 [Steccherinum ochraceum]